MRKIAAVFSCAGLNFRKWRVTPRLYVVAAVTLVQMLCGGETVKELPLNGVIEYVDTFMLTMAMTALGAETSIDKFKQAGAKPFLLAGGIYVWLVVGGYFLTKMIVD